MEATFNTHFYKWNGLIHRQTEGDLIGLRATGTIARVAMNQWLRSFKAKIKRAGMTVNLLSKYVDDFLSITEILERGARGKDGSVTYYIKNILEDIESGKSRPQILLDVL